MKRHGISQILFISLVMLVSGKVFGGQDDAAKQAKWAKSTNVKKEQVEYRKTEISGHRATSPTNIPSAILHQPTKQVHDLSSDEQEALDKKLKSHRDATILPPKPTYAAPKPQQSSADITHPQAAAEAEAPKKTTFGDKLKSWFTTKPQPKQPETQVDANPFIKSFKGKDDSGIETPEYPKKEQLAEPTADEMTAAHRFVPGQTGPEISAESGIPKKAPISLEKLKTAVEEITKKVVSGEFISEGDKTRLRGAETALTNFRTKIDTKIQISSQAIKKAAADIKKLMDNAIHATAQAKKDILAQIEKTQKELAAKKENHVNAVRDSVSATKTAVELHGAAITEYQKAINGSPQDTDSLKQLQVSRDSFKSAQKAAETQAKELDTAIKEVDQKVAQETKKVTQFGTDIKRLEAKIQTQVKVMQGISDSISKVRENGNEPGPAATNKLAEMNDVLKKLQENKAAMQKAARTAQSDIMKLRTQSRALSGSLKTAEAVLAAKIPADDRTPQQLADTVSILRAAVKADPRDKDAQATLKSATKDAEQKLKELEQKRKDDAKKLRGLRKLVEKQRNNTEQQTKTKQERDALSTAMITDLITRDSLKAAIAGKLPKGVKAPTQAPATSIPVQEQEKPGHKIILDQL
ncbi:MAG: hypothetical protein US49_C0003G0094 [candidate division TM6 bacterium GW2011_GWF2_37_49]|nr:MAG: hypothetical protein US49_C0003G0094 [candidate division TM6 bacterium GW2011_GWF2_37_49]